MGYQIIARYLWDGTAAQAGPFAVSVEGDRIRAIEPPRGRPAGQYEILDCGDATILPGLIDMHTHLGINHRAPDIRGQMKAGAVRHILAGLQNLRADLESGVTTAKLNGDRDGFDIQLREAIRDATAHGPRLLVSGRGIKSSRCTGGVVATAIVDDAAAVGRAVEDNISAGADWIKLFASGSVFGPLEGVLEPFYGQSQLTTAAETAHRAGKKMSAHCFGGDAADACVAAGVDVIDHGWLLSDRQHDAMAGTETRLCPTIGVLLHPDGILPHVPAEELDAAKRRIGMVVETTARAIGMGVPLLVGTDGMHGDLVFEMSVLQDLGARPETLLRAATSDAAQMLGLAGEIGAVRAGAAADLLVVAGNAREDVRRLKHVRLVLQGGAVIKKDLPVRRFGLAVPGPQETR